MGSLFLVTLSTLTNHIVNKLPAILDMFVITLQADTLK